MISRVSPNGKTGTPIENRDKIPFSYRSTAALILLIVAGFLGNYYTLPLFFGADFLFGSIAVLLVLYFYGFSLGMLAAVIAHGYTYLLWGHPYGFINFTCEILFIGIFLKRGRRNLLILDGLFWLLIGMPMAWIEHGIIMHMGTISALFIMLKQAVNGVFNTLLVSLAICYLPLNRVFQRPQLSRNITLRESFFNQLVMMVLFPALLLTMLESRYEKEKLESGAMADLQTLSLNVQVHINSWYQIHLKAVQELAALASQSFMKPSVQLQHGTKILKRSFADFHTMHVENGRGRSIAFEPRINEKGESTIGLDFSGRAWFQESKAKQQPLVSEVFEGSKAVFSPIINLCVPVFRERRWLGCATGTLNLKRLQEMLLPYRSDRGVGLTLLDSQGRIIASTEQGEKTLQSWDRKKTGLLQPLNAQMSLWQPDDKKLPSMTRWKESFYVMETLMGEALPWKLIAEVPVAPLQSILYAIYVKNLAVMAVLITLALLLSHMLSKDLVRPLDTLAQVTVNLPEKLLGSHDIRWPESNAHAPDDRKSFLGHGLDFLQAGSFGGLGAGDLVGEEEAGDSPALLPLRRRGRSDVVGRQHGFNLDPLVFRHLRRRVEVHDVTLVTPVKIEDPGAPVDGLGHLQHLAGGGGRKDVADGSSVHQSFSHVAHEHRQVPGSSPGGNGHLTLHGGIGPYDGPQIPPCRLEGLGMGLQDSLHHFIDHCQRVINDLFHLVDTSANFFPYYPVNCRFVKPETASRSILALMAFRPRQSIWHADIGGSCPGNLTLPEEWYINFF